MLKPQRVVLILNSFYGGTPGIDHGGDLKNLMLYLNQNQSLGNFSPQLSANNFDLVELPDDTPTHVFRALREAFQKSAAQPPAGCTNVVDITGAKNSMIVGAFLYAAHSGLPITYVDFGEYDSDWRRPYGYTCRIGAIANPYEAFHLRDWEQVRRLYESYNFRGARDSLKQIVHAMSSTLDEDNGREKLFNDNDINNVRKLGLALEMYEAWDSGNFKQAAIYGTSIPQPDLPSAITELGPHWLTVTSSGVSGGPNDFYADLKSLGVYAADEISRIKRLIHHNQDYRSAFLRAAGLNEVILTARLVKQITDSSLRRRLLDALNTKIPNSRRLFLELRKNEGEAIRMDKLGLDGEWPERPTIIQQMNTWWTGATGFSGNNGWEQFLELRNILAHRYVSVDQQTSENALSFVAANFEDFFGYSVNNIPWNVAAVRWSRACELFDLNFLPPQLRTDI